jgi:hypothetical protein
MELHPQNLEKALQLLGKLLAIRKREPFWLVICGGSALLARQIISRSTHDVDVLALRDLEGGMDLAYPLPAVLKQAARQVAEELGLEPNWLNSAASLHFPDLRLLPASLWQELDTRAYSDSLKVSFVTRNGQILLKLYAALNRAKARDFGDLSALSPDSTETANALRWLLTKLPVLTHRDQLPALLTHLGHGHLIPEFQD